MVIGEVASDDRGGSKAAWVKDMLRVIPARYPKVRAIVWYEEKDQGMHWPIESNRASRKAFAREIARPIFRPNLYANLAGPGPIKPPTR
jgi:hypothetical protein